MKKVIYLSISLMLLLMSCATTNNVYRYTIASANADCVGVAPQKCLLVKKGDAKNWEFFYSGIDGFNYEPGYEYVLDVKEEKRENTPADVSSIKYTLVKEVSKTAKISDNLPPSFNEQVSYYQAIGIVLSVNNENIGRGAASGSFEVKVIELEVSSSTIKDVKGGDTIYCELINTPRVNPVVGREYVFKSHILHPAHAKGVYMLDTDVMDLVH